jgi:hypothetical protein
MNPPPLLNHQIMTWNIQWSRNQTLLKKMMSIFLRFANGTMTSNALQTYHIPNMTHSFTIAQSSSYPPTTYGAKIPMANTNLSFHLRDGSSY